MSVCPGIIVATITGIPRSYLEWLGSNCQAVSYTTMDAIVRLTTRVSLDGGGAGVLLPHLSGAGKMVSSQQKQIMAITMKMRARSVINQKWLYLFGLNGFNSGWPWYYVHVRYTVRLIKSSTSNIRLKVFFLSSYFFGFGCCVLNKALCSNSDDLPVPLALSCEGR